jgi:hypothetical protein
LREFVDYDYDDALPEDARIWLAAFSEEYYRGWRLKKETQLLNLTQIREAGAIKRLRGAHQDPLAFSCYRGELEADPTQEGDPEACLVAALDWHRDK